jgi:hypothetical protein
MQRRIPEMSAKSKDAGSARTAARRARPDDETRAQDAGKRPRIDTVASGVPFELDAHGGLVAGAPGGWMAYALAQGLVGDGEPSGSCAEASKGDDGTAPSDPGPGDRCTGASGAATLSRDNESAADVPDDGSVSSGGDSADDGSISSGGDSADDAAAATELAVSAGETARGWLWANGTESELREFLGDRNVEWPLLPTRAELVAFVRDVSKDVGDGDVVDYVRFVDGMRKRRIAQSAKLTVEDARRARVLARGIHDWAFAIKLLSGSGEVVVLYKPHGSSPDMLQFVRAGENPSAASFFHGKASLSLGIDRRGYNNLTILPTDPFLPRLTPAQLWTPRREVVFKVDNAQIHLPSGEWRMTFYPFEQRIYHSDIVRDKERENADDQEESARSDGYAPIRWLGDTSSLSYVMDMQLHVAATVVWQSLTVRAVAFDVALLIFRFAFHFESA